MNKCQAFSLIEILLTLTICIILFAITLPGLTRFLQQSDQERLASSLMGVLQFAKQEAMIRHEIIGACFADANNECNMASSNRMVVFNEAHEILLVTQFKTRAGKFRLRSYPYYRDYFLFSGAGVTRSDNATIWYCEYHDELPAFAVVLGKSGNPSLRKPNKHGVMKDGNGGTLVC